MRFVLLQPDETALLHLPLAVHFHHGNGNFLLGAVAEAEDEKGVGQLERRVASGDIRTDAYLVETIVLALCVGQVLPVGSQHADL